MSDFLLTLHKIEVVMFCAIKGMEPCFPVKLHNGQQLAPRCGFNGINVK